MGKPSPPGETIGGALDLARRRTFVGRTAELELVRAALASRGADASDEPGAVRRHSDAVIWFSGPGGIGKSSLLEAVAGEVAGTVPTVHVDGHDTRSTPSFIERAVAERFHGHRGPAMVLVDAYERLTPLDRWFRERFLPGLPAPTVVVVASRHAPSSAWRADPTWRGAIREVALRNLEPDEGRRFLQHTDIDPELHERLLALSHGHPLGLSLLAEVVLGGGEPAIDGTTPDLVADLLSRFVDVTPSAEHRRALGVCALARTTDESLLRAVLGGDAADAFDWLRSRSFVGTGRDGLVPHDLARDVVDADLRWRDPEQYTQVFRAVRRHVHDRLRSAPVPERRAAVLDLKFLFRNLPSVLSPVDWETWGSVLPERARREDRPAIGTLVGNAEGPTAASIADRWFDVQPEAFHVVRDDDGELRGVIAVVDLSAARRADLDADPAARAAWRHAQEVAPPRADEVVTQTRFVVDRDAYQGPSPTMNATPVVTLLTHLEIPHLARDYLTIHEPEPWEPFFELADYPRARGIDVEIDGRRYGMFCHDFRRTPVDDLIELWTERALAQDPTLRLRSPTTLVLSRSEFAHGVRSGLRDLHRPGELARNPLTRTRVVRDRPDSRRRPAVALAQLLRETAAGLTGTPRDDKLGRAVDRTYVRPAPTQEAAAELLDLPFSTYRRHLVDGVAAIVERLWDRELYGDDRSHGDGDDAN